MGEEYFWLLLAAFVFAFIYFRYVRPEKVLGGREIKPVDMQGFTVASPYVDRPLL